MAPLRPCFVGVGIVIVGPSICWLGTYNLGDIGHLTVKSRKTSQEPDVSVNTGIPRPRSTMIPLKHPVKSQGAPYGPLLPWEGDPALLYRLYTPEIKKLVKGWF